MAVKVYVLIVTTPGSTNRVFNSVSQGSNVIESHQVLGPYDIVVKIEAPSLTSVPRILSGQIRSVEGILSTTSLVSFPDPE